MEERIGPCKVLCQFGGVPLELAAAGNVGVWSPFPESGIGQFCRWSRSSWSFVFLEERYYILCKVLRQHLFGDCQPIQLGCEEQIREGTEGSIKTTWKACFAFTPTYLTVRTIFFSYASSSAPHPCQLVIRWVVVSNYRSLELASWLAFFSQTINHYPIIDITDHSGRSDHWKKARRNTIYISVLRKSHDQAGLIIWKGKVKQKCVCNMTWLNWKY